MRKSLEKNVMALHILHVVINREIDRHQLFIGQVFCKAKIFSFDIDVDCNFFVYRRHIVSD